MKILVYGAGVLGSLYAACLQDAGNEVTLLARGSRASAVRTNGIVLQNALSGERSISRVEVIEHLTPEDYYDLVIVLMRRNQVPSILPELASNKNTPNILFVGNNVSGPDEYIRALGRERVLIGFASSGGMRKGNVVRYATGLGDSQPRITIGETDGGLSLRLEAIARTLQDSGFRVSVSSNMDAWLKTHAAVVIPVAGALYLAGGDNYRLARTRDGLTLLVRAMREGFDVLHALGIPLLPRGVLLYEWLPEPLLVWVLGLLMNTELAEIMMAGHANTARDEMKELADEFSALARSSGVPTPAWNRLLGYFDPQAEPMAQGYAEIPLDWYGVWVGLAAIGALVLLVTRIRGRDLRVK